VQPFGRDLSIPRQGSTVSREVPDLLEFFLLFGGGSLVIKREGQVVARIDHIPFLGRRMVALEAMLGVTRVQSHDPA
jgi:ABC-type arginine transport system permease subunit